MALAALAATAAPPPPGPCSRRTPLVVSEIMYHPAPRTDGRVLEFVELYNSEPFPADLGGFRLAGDIDYAFPAGFRLAATSAVVIAAVPADLAAAQGVTNALGPYTNRLANDRGTVRLLGRWGQILLEIRYDDDSPWPLAADGAGHSLICAQPTYGEADPRAWSPSPYAGGSPGSVESAPPVASALMINEVLAHTDPPQVDFIEIYNHSTLAKNLSGCWITDEPGTNKYRIPSNTVLGARGFAVFTESQLGFALNAAGDEVLLLAADGQTVLDALRFGGQANGQPLGRDRDGAAVFSSLAFATPGATNAPRRVPSVVINEIMYHPLSENSGDEYVELANRGAAATNIAGWRFTAGIDYRMPEGTTIPAGGFLVVARDAARLLATHPDLPLSSVVGDFSGALDDGGERLALARPDTVIAFDSNTGTSVTGVIDLVEDEVTYGDGGAWGAWSDGGGSSLERIDLRADGRRPAAWADSDESGKSAWTTVAASGILDQGHPAVSTIDHLYVYLMEKGAARIDDVEVVWNGINRITNGTFEAGDAGWYYHGTHRLSGLATGGYQSLRSLRIECVDRGDAVNRVRAPLSATLASNTPVVVRARARWLRGSPELIFRLSGGSHEAAGRLPVPENLGTPGAANSRQAANDGPAVWAVTHRPTLPAGGQPVVVTARVSDPDGVASVSLRWRADPATSVTATAMNDAGTGGDAVAGDGEYAATLPAQAGGTIVAFFVEAADRASPAATGRFPRVAPAREALVRYGDSAEPGPFGAYRMWITRATFDFWAAREKTSNEDVDTTFVDGSGRVIYNAGTHYGCSENYSSGLDNPTGRIVGYHLDFPADEPFLGVDTIRVDFPVRDTTLQREKLMHWMLEQLGLPSLNRRYIHFFLNGVRRGSIYIDTERPNGDVLEKWYAPDDGGDLLKTDPWYEFTPTGTFLGGAFVHPRLTNYLSAGVLKMPRYRFNWRPRAVRGLAGDYTNFFALVDAAQAPAGAYESAVSGVTDLDNWMRTFAMNDLASFWDGFGNPNSKNSFLYKPQDSGWKILSWDFDVGLGVYNDPTNAPLFAGDIDPALQRMVNTPAFVRRYWAAIEEGMNGFFVATPGTAIDTFLSEHYAVLAGTVSGVVSPFVPSGAYGLSVPNWIAGRRGFIAPQLAAMQTNFTVAGPAFVVTNRNVAVLTGTAPLAFAALAVNGVLQPVEWTSVTQWRLEVPLAAGTNVLDVSGMDRAGAVLTTRTAAVTAVYTGAAEAAEGRVVFSELMPDIAEGGGPWAELYNRSALTTFDLSGWRIDGLDATFPEGTRLGPGGRLVVAADRVRFSAVWGAGIPTRDVLGGTLRPEGETLTLLRPGANPGEEIEVDRIRIENTLPWPSPPAGSSWQVVDPAQDRARVANWAVAPAPPPAATQILVSITNGWRYNQTENLDGVSWAGSAYVDAAWPTGRALFCAGAQSLPAPSNTPLTLGRLTHYFRTPCVLDIHPSLRRLRARLTVDDGAVVYVNGTEVLRVGMPAGAVIYSTLSNRIVTNAAYEGPFDLPSSAFLPGTNVMAVEVHQHVSNSADAVFGAEVWAEMLPPVAVGSPGASNPVGRSLAPFPPVWLNEVQAENLSGPTDAAGDHDPWVELVNAGTSAVSLAGWFLSDRYDQLTRWAFPTGAQIASGFATTWLDGEPAENSATQWHASFRLDGLTGAVVLARISGGETQVVDYLNYAHGPDRGYGSVPDAQPFVRRELYFVSPGGTNRGESAPLSVRINEWVADNAGPAGQADPADGDFDDWFELLNTGSTTARLDGCFLTDDLDDRFQFAVPTGYAIPPGGFLVVWADSEPGQNATNRPDLHVNFKLNQTGEAIGLFAADGTPIDTVTFTTQVTNVSQGRDPDGGEGLRSFSPPTLGASNVAAQINTAPMLDPAGPVTAHVGQVVHVTLRAHDADQPPQALRYDLDPPVPAGATVDPVSGVVTWPTAGAAAGHYTLAARATDDGAPPLSATRSVEVELHPPPYLGMQWAAGGVLQIPVSTIPGGLYILEYADSLPGAPWLYYGEAEAAGPDLDLPVDASEGPLRFYRVLTPAE